MRKICFLHGFLGCPEDWDQIITKLSQYECSALSYPFIVPKDCVIVGYSMGGRIALTYPNPKIVIGANPLPQDRQWIVDKLVSKPFLQFLHEWYDQPLFATLKNHPDFPAIFARRLKVDPTIALQQAQEKGGNSLDALFLSGDMDTKYKDLYSKLSVMTKQIPRSGHACHLENPDSTASIISDFMARGGHL